MHLWVTYAEDMSKRSLDMRDLPSRQTDKQINHQINILTKMQIFTSSKPKIVKSMYLSKCKFWQRINRQTIKRTYIKRLMLASNKQNVKRTYFPKCRASDYVAEGNCQLNHPNHYMRFDRPIFQNTSKIVDSILQDLYNHNFISAKQLLYLRPSTNPRPRRIYMLLQIHIKWDKWPFFK